MPVRVPPTSFRFDSRALDDSGPLHEFGRNEALEFVSVTPIGFDTEALEPLEDLRLCQCSLESVGQDSRHLRRHVGRTKHADPGEQIETWNDRFIESWNI